MWETHARADGVHTAAINSPNGPVADSVGSVRIDCGSWCRAGDDLRLAQARVSELLNGSGRVDLEPPVPIAAAMATSQSSPVVTGPSQLRRWRWRADRIRRVVEKGRLGAYSYDRPVPVVLPPRGRDGSTRVSIVLVQQDSGRGRRTGCGEAAN